MTARVLIADDSPELRALLEGVLRKSGYQVFSAADGQEALDTALSAGPDIIILDAEMPALDGFDVLSRLRQDAVTACIPVIMLTVLNSEEAALRGLSAGVDEYIVKPFSPAQLLRRIRLLLDQRSGTDMMRDFGSGAVRAEADRRASLGIPCTALFADIAGFKGYNQRYGTRRGDEVITYLERLVMDAVRHNGGKGAVCGHLAADEFVALCEPDAAMRIAEYLVKRFDESRNSFLDPEDTARGYMVVFDRGDHLCKLPLMTLRVALVAADAAPGGYGAMVQCARELKNLTRSSSRSMVVTDRRGRR